MKFFHISDLHIGLKLCNRDLLTDQEYVLRQITQLAAKEQPDAVLVAGDIYDRAVPSAEAVETFDRFLMDLTRAVPDAAIMMISGNHDSAPRINCYRGLLERQNLYLIGQPPLRPDEHIEKVTLRDEFGPVNFYLLPFVKPSMVRAVVGAAAEESQYDSPAGADAPEPAAFVSSGTDPASDQTQNVSSSAPDPVSASPGFAASGALTYDEAVRRLLLREDIDTSERNVLVSHQFYLPAGSSADEVERMDSEIRTVGNIDAVSADVLEPFDYAALGHIHKPMKVGSEFFRYCGTPMPYSVSEAGQQKGVIAAELGAPSSRPVFRVLPLRPLHEVRVLRGSLEELVRESCDDYICAVLTDRVDLDVLDMQDRLRAAFPNLLEIRREAVRTADYSRAGTRQKEMDPFELCCSFLGELDEGEQELLRDVLRTVQEQEGCVPLSRQHEV